MYEIPEIVPGPPRDAPALEARERVTSTRCLDGIKAKLASIFTRVTSSEGTVDSTPRDGAYNLRPAMADAARLTREFLADPAVVLRGDDRYGLTVANPFVKANFADVPKLGKSELGGPDYYLYEQSSNAGIRFYETHPNLYRGVHNIEVAAAAEEDDARVQFLPWKDSKLTYCKLWPDADLVLTGPITGCSVYVVEIAGSGPDDGTYLFHVNANESGLKGPRAAEAQRVKFEAALDRLWPDDSVRTVTHRLNSNDYRSPVEDTDPDGLVYGTRTGSGWNFSYYVIDFGPTGVWTKRDDLPAPLPRV